MQQVDQAAVINDFLLEADKMSEEEQQAFYSDLEGLNKTYFPTPKQDLMHRSDKDEIWCYGGNGSGKTVFNLNEGVYHVTHQHPYSNRFENTPVKWWYACVDWDAQRELQPELIKYLPGWWIKKTTFRQRGIIDFIQGHDGGQIKFKSYKSGREAFQVARVQLMSGDEETPYDIYGEMKARGTGVGGIRRFVMTPSLKGLTWSYKKVYLTRAKTLDTRDVFNMHLDENITLDAGEIAAKKLEYVGAEYDARIEGKWRSFVGLIYDFDINTMLIPPFKIPSSWRRVAIIDPGTAVPCAVNWFALSNDYDLYVLGTYYVANKDIETHTRGIKAMSEKLDKYHGKADYERLVYFCDPAAAQERKEFAKYGIFTGTAKTSRVGITRLKQYMRPYPPNGKSKFFVLDGWGNDAFVDEMIDYKWKTTYTSMGQEAVDEPQDTNDHCMNNAKYAANYFPCLADVMKAAMAPPVEEAEWRPQSRVAGY